MVWSNHRCTENSGAASSLQGHRTPVLLMSPSLISRTSKWCAQPVSCVAHSRCSINRGCLCSVLTMITTMHWAPGHTETGQHPRI